MEQVLTLDCQQQGAPVGRAIGNETEPPPQPILAQVVSCTVRNVEHVFVTYLKFSHLTGYGQTMYTLTGASCNGTGELYTACGQGAPIWPTIGVAPSVCLKLLGLLASIAWPVVSLHLWAWPRQTTYKQTDRLKTARGRGAPIPVLITFRCLRLMRPLGLRPRSLGLWPRYLCVHAIIDVA